MYFQSLCIIWYAFCVKILIKIYPTILLGTMITLSRNVLHQIQSFRLKLICPEHTIMFSRVHKHLDSKGGEKLRLIFFVLSSMNLPMY